MKHKHAKNATANSKSSSMTAGSKYHKDANGRFRDARGRFVSTKLALD